MAADDRPEQSWPADVIARMRRIAQAPKALVDEAEAKRLRQPSPKRKKAAK